MERGKQILKETREGSVMPLACATDETKANPQHSGCLLVPPRKAIRYGTNTYNYVTLHFRDQRGAASLRYRNRAKITVLMCEQKPCIRSDFRAGAKATIRCSVNTA